MGKNGENRFNLARKCVPTVTDIIWYGFNVRCSMDRNVMGGSWKIHHPNTKRVTVFAQSTHSAMRITLLKCTLSRVSHSNKKMLDRCNIQNWQERLTRTITCRPYVIHHWKLKQHAEALSVDTWVRDFT